MREKTDIGRVVPLYKGGYTDGCEYELNDVVRYNDRLYWHISKAKTEGVSPENGEVWALAVEAPELITDATLSESGRAADAKAAGDAIAAMRARKNIPAALSEGGCAALGELMRSYFIQSANGDLVYKSWRNLYLEKYRDETLSPPKNAIQCSGFTGAAVNAISYENSRYNGRENNIALPYGFAWDSTVHSTPEYPGETSGAHPGEINVTAKNQAIYAKEHGYLWEATDTHIQPACGDLFFSGGDGQIENISHTGVVLCASDIHNPNAELRVLEAWTTGIRQHTYSISEIKYFARFPLGYSGTGGTSVFTAKTLSNSELSSAEPTVIEDFQGATLSAFGISPATWITGRIKASVNYKSGKSAYTGNNFSMRIDYTDGEHNTAGFFQLGEYYCAPFITDPSKTVSRIRILAKGDTQITAYNISELRLDIGLCPTPVI